MKSIFSTKTYVYQAAGKPMLCCSTGQLGRYVSENKSGIVVKPGDYEALANATLYLIENNDNCWETGASGRQYVENNLSVEKIGLEMMTVFNRVLRNPSSLQ